MPDETPTWEDMHDAAARLAQLLERPAPDEARWLAMVEGYVAIIDDARVALIPGQYGVDDA